MHLPWLALTSREHFRCSLKDRLFLVDHFSRMNCVHTWSDHRPWRMCRKWWKGWDVVLMTNSDTSRCRISHWPPRVSSPVWYSSGVMFVSHGPFCLMLTSGEIQTFPHTLMWRLFSLTAKVSSVAFTASPDVDQISVKQTTGLVETVRWQHTTRIGLVPIWHWDGVCKWCKTKPLVALKPNTVQWSSTPPSSINWLSHSM